MNVEMIKYHMQIKTKEGIKEYSFLMASELSEASFFEIFNLRFVNLFLRTVRRDYDDEEAVLSMNYSYDEMSEDESKNFEEWEVEIQYVQNFAYSFKVTFPIFIERGSETSKLCQKTLGFSDDWTWYLTLTNTEI